MSLTHFIKSHFNLSELLDPTALDAAAPVDQFRAMIQKERHLADRTGRRLSVLIYNTDMTSPSDLAKLIDTLKGRIRDTEDIGWMPPNELGILLRATTYEGAEVLAKTLTMRLTQEHPPFAWKIFCYPENPEMTEALAPPFPTWKRMTDIIASATILLCLSPLLILISLGIVLVAPGPVFFQQERIGYLGRRFMCLKFRSMKVNASTASHRAYLKELIYSGIPLKKLDEAHDPRIIPLGRLMRASALDELPQLFNVLKGDMSLVGPRPCLDYEYETFLRWHKRRFESFPGLTGLWQVSGKNKTSFAEMIRLDVAYERRRSFLFDLMIMARTPLVLLEQLIDTFNPPLKEQAYESAH